MDNPGSSHNKSSAIEVHNLSKCYRIYTHPRDRLIQAAWGRNWHGRKKQYFKEFWALRELSFQLAKGQTLGIIGRNGSGKSTLLQMICGTLEPTTGNVRVNGRIGALLELGSGFNPEFTGLENVYLNAALLGLNRRETEERLEQILGFADIGSFIDQPVKTYSSGMAVRLAFAVQAHVDPDVLVVDEALAVGDELFQKKCYAHLERLKERGTSIVLVTHSCPQIIQHSDQALLLHKGQARLLGEPARVTTTYQRLINASDEEWDLFFTNKQTTGSKSREQQQRKEQEWLDPNLQPKSTEIYPSHGAEVIDAWIENAQGHSVNVLPTNQPFCVVIRYQAKIELKDLSFACNLARTTGQRITGQTYGSRTHIDVTAGEQWEIRFFFMGGLWPDVYFLSSSILHENEEGRHFIHRVIDYRALRIRTEDPLSPIGACNLQSRPPELKALKNTQEQQTPLTGYPEKS